MTRCATYLIIKEMEINSTLTNIYIYEYIYENILLTRLEKAEILITDGNANLYNFLRVEFMNV